MDSSAMPSDFMPLLRKALRASIQSSLEDAPLHTTEEFSPEDRERFKPIIDGIHFSMRLVLSYQLVLIALLAALAFRHWIGRLRVWGKRRRQDKESRHHDGDMPIAKPFEGKEDAVIGSRSVGSSSSSSTLRGDITPPQPILEGERTEHTPLLLKTQAPKPTLWWLVTSKIKALLTYQPAPIPIVNKALPSNGSSLAIIAFLGLQVFYLFYKTPLSLSTLFVSADRASLLFVANLPWLYLFAAKNQPIKFLTGYSYESLNIIHRRLGEVMCLLALLHSAGMMGVWYTLLRLSGMTLVDFLLKRMILLGIGAFVAYELIYFTSLGSFRQHWYELFLGLHVVLQIIALVLVWFHHPRSRIYVGVALGIFLIDRLLYRTSAKMFTTRALLGVKGDGKTVVLCAPIPSEPRSNVFGSFFGAYDITRGWKATEHVFLTVPSLARKHIFQAHPFTIASKAPQREQIGANLKLIIRAQDGFSADLLSYARGHKSVDIRLDGPYGSQSAVQMLQESDHAIIIVGGSGIAVGWPLVSALLEVMGNNDPENPNTSRKRGEILFIWVVREQSHLAWLGREGLVDLEAAGVKCWVPPPTANNGHPDIRSFINEWVISLDGTHGVEKTFGVVASGPDGLNRSVRNACAALVREGRNVNVEIEKFGW